jgi:hypothetical protein
MQVTSLERNNCTDQMTPCPMLKANVSDKKRTSILISFSITLQMIYRFPQFLSSVLTSIFSIKLPIDYDYSRPL